VRINQQIAGEIAFVDQPLSGLTLVPLGPGDIEVVASTPAGEQSQFAVRSGEVLDLYASLGLDHQTHGMISVAARKGQYRRAYEIHVKDAPIIDFGELDRLVQQAQEPLKNGQPADWRMLRDHGSAPASGPLQRRYLLGFAEYLLACNLEAIELVWPHAQRQYEAAFGMLRIFSSDLARSALAVLAFRMDAFTLLKQNGPQSLFWQPAVFFGDQDQHIRPDSARRRPGAGIWVDEFQEGLLRGVAAYYRGDLIAADAEARGLPRSLTQDPANRRKMLLLQARVAAALHDKERARRAYDELRDDPTFGREAQEALA
jgi:hypothetical protein